MKTKLQNLRNLVAQYEEAAAENNSPSVISQRNMISGGDPCRDESNAVEAAAKAVETEVRLLARGGNRRLFRAIMAEFGCYPVVSDQAEAAFDYEAQQ